MIDRPRLKSMAKAQLSGNLPTLILIGVVMVLVCMIPLAGVILLPALTLSVCMIYLNLTYGEPVRFSDCFCGLNHLGKAWWLYILVAFFTYLWSLLFVIPGIIKGLSYSMAPFVLADDPTLTARDALNISKQITFGYKMELFLLYLSFLGWLLLVAFTAGIASVWVFPYMSATYANFYQIIKNNRASA